MRKSYSISYDFQLTQGQDFTEEFSIIEPGSQISVRSITMQGRARDVVTTAWKGLGNFGDVQANLRCLGQRLPGSFVPITGLMPAVVDNEAPDNTRLILLPEPCQLFFGPGSVVATDNLMFMLQADNNNANIHNFWIVVVVEADITRG